MKPMIRLHPSDNVAIALAPLSAGSNISVDELNETLLQDVDKGHKVALQPIASGADVIKYGAPIGHAVADIAAGAWVHTEQIKTNLNDELAYRYQPVADTVAPQVDDSPEVMIYRRSDGQVGIRNELWVIPSVGCVNGMAAQMVKQFLQHHPDLEIDGVHVFTHQFGCSQLGDDLQQTKKLLQNMIEHPNTGGVLVVGLGCENNQVSAIKLGVEQRSDDRVKYLITQQVEDEIEAGLEQLEALYKVMRHDKREPGKLTEIHFDLKCGGSDGLSGITANPMLGQLSDYLIARGGTTVLTEVPEMFGAETILMSRCKDETTFEQLVEMVNGFKRYYKKHDQPVYANPSPGNKKGGITTLEDKSLGCTQKAGQSRVEAILNFGERLQQPGCIYSMRRGMMLLLPVPSPLVAAKWCCLPLAAVRPMAALCRP